MTIFEKQILEFLKRQEAAHKCNVCNSIMKFQEKHGYYQCPKCKLPKGEKIIKAPQVLIAVGNKQILLFWTRCPDCGKTNVTDLSQEKYHINEKTHKLTENKKQIKIKCTHCRTDFFKGDK